MTGSKSREKIIVDSWHTNAKAWCKAIANDEIESRKLVTNQAILDTVLRYQPAAVLDIGCGEGWLCRQLADHDIATTGIDAVPALIDKARELGKGQFIVRKYNELAGSPELQGMRFDLLVANFSLLGKDSTSSVLKAAHLLLKNEGLLIVQTLHPAFACGDLPYLEGWREGSWVGFSSEFKDPAPWYFRPLQSWIEEFNAARLSLSVCCEPLHPVTQQPVSIIFILKP